MYFILVTNIQAINQSNLIVLTNESNTNYYKNYFKKYIIYNKNIL